MWPECFIGPGQNIRHAPHLGPRAPRPADTSHNMLGSDRQVLKVGDLSDMLFNSRSEPMLNKTAGTADKSIYDEYNMQRI